jgi:exosortase
LASDGDTHQEVAHPVLWKLSRGRTVRNVCFGTLVGLTLTVFWVSLTMLIRFSLQQQQHNSHIILIPLISAALLIRERQRIFSRLETHWFAGLALVVAGALFYSSGHRYSAAASENDQLSVAIFAVVVIWIGGFVLCYGLRSLRAGLFPLLFLFFMVPIPDFVLNRTILWLQTGSAEVSYAAFELAGVPVFRTGFVFSLPGVTIEVAKECSGIRSSLALLITTLLAGHLFLRSPWRKAVLILVAVPLLIVKNGIRIVTLSLLSIYVDPSFLTGSLHHKGGFVFFLLALALLAPVLWLLEKSERIESLHRSR